MKFLYLKIWTSLIYCDPLNTGYVIKYDLVIGIETYLIDKNYENYNSFLRKITYTTDGRKKFIKNFLKGV